LAELAAGDVAHGGAWVFCVYPGVEDTVEGHCGAASADHRKDDVEECESRGVDVKIEVTPGEECSSEGKRHGKDRVFELDHVERATEPLKKT